MIITYIVCTVYVYVAMCMITGVKDSVQLNNNYNASRSQPIVIGVGETVNFTAFSIYNRNNISFMYVCKHMHTYVLIHMYVCVHNHGCFGENPVFMYKLCNLKYIHMYIQGLASRLMHLLLQLFNDANCHFVSKTFLNYIASLYIVTSCSSTV